MARLLGPDSASRTIYLAPSGAQSAAGRTATVYTDAAATVLASIALYDGTATPGATIAGSAVTMDSESRLPQFWFPDGVDVLYVRVGGRSGVVQIGADVDARLDGTLAAAGGTVTGDVSFANNKGIKLYALTGDSSITYNLVLESKDQYSRAWIVSRDHTPRTQAAIGWHGVNSGDAVTHNAWEVKTSVSTGNPSPNLMQTRFAVQGNKDLADIVINYVATIHAYKPDDSGNKTFVVDAQTGEIKSQVDSSNYLSVRKKTTAGSIIQAVDATGSATLDLEATPSDGTSAGSIRLFRNTNTSNSGTALSVYKANNTSTIQHFLSAKSNAYFCADAGNVGIGNSSPSAKLHVTGDTFRLETARTPASAGATGNVGDVCWDTGFIYVCTATNTWKRAALATW